MKRQIFFVTALVALLLVVIVPAQAALRPNVIVSGFSVKEGKAEVGKDFTLVLNLTNVEPATCAMAVTTSVQAGPPFIMNGISKLSPGDICSASSIPVEFPVKVDPTATGGFYQMTILNSYETATLAQFSSSDTINVFVSGTPDMNAHITGSDPLDVYPGDTAALTVSIDNDGSYQAQSVHAVMKAESPLEVNWAKSFNSLGTIDARQSKQAGFSVEIPKDAPAKDYMLSFEIQYLDENLVSQVKDFAFVFHVKHKAFFETADAGSDTLYADQSGKAVKLLLKDTGTDDARRVKAKILPQYPFSTDGSVRYIDLLQQGQSSPLLFTIDIDKDATPGTYGLDMLVDYEDAQGKKLQDTAKVSLTVRQKSIFRQIFIDYWFIWIVLIVLAAVIIQRKAKGKKKKD